MIHSLTNWFDTKREPLSSCNLQIIIFLVLKNFVYNLLTG